MGNYIKATGSFFPGSDLKFSTKMNRFSRAKISFIVLPYSNESFDEPSTSRTNASVSLKANISEKLFLFIIYQVDHFEIK